MPLSWVIGAGGLLGTSTVAALEPRGPVWRPEKEIPWGEPDTTQVLKNAAKEFLAEAGNDRWQIAWCAGAAVTGSTAEDLARDVAVFEGFLAELATSMPHRNGAVFLASSVGGVYAGAEGAPFDEFTAPVALSPYGQGKLEMEAFATEFASTAGIPVMLGRISNLYGPNQNLNKPQGLISQICRAQILRQPLSIYVPMDTVRDYIYAPDCGEMIADSLALLQRQDVKTGAAPVLTKILASQQGVSIGFLVSEVRRIFKRAPKIVYGSSPSARFQVRDLRVRSRVLPDLDRRALTPLPVGIRRTVDVQVGLVQQAILS